MTDIEWKFKNKTDCFNEEFWYDLTEGGYIKPEELLEDKDQIQKLNEAIEIVKSFENAINSLSEDEDDD